MSQTVPEAVPLVHQDREGADTPHVYGRGYGHSPLVSRATGWLLRLVVVGLGLFVVALLAAVRRHPTPPLPALVEMPVPAHLPLAPQGSDLMILKLGVKGVPVLRSGAWAGVDAGVHSSRATRAVVVQHGIGRDMDHAWRDVYSALNDSERGSTLILAPNFYLASDAGPGHGRGRWFDPDTMHAWADFDAWVGGSDALNSSVSTYDLYDALRAHLLDRRRYPALEQVVFAGHSGGGATMTRYSLFAADWPKVTPSLALASRLKIHAVPSVRYVVANAPSFLYFTPDRPQTPPCPDAGRYMYGLDQPVRYVRTRLALDKLSDRDPRFLVRRWLARPLVMLQGDQDTYARYPVGRYGCEVLSQGGKDRRERSYAYWVYKVLLAGLPLTHAKVGGQQRWKSLAFVGRDHLEASVTPWGTSDWSFAHDFCHVLNVGHVGGEMWRSSCGRAALLGAGIDEAVW